VLAGEFSFVLTMLHRSEFRGRRHLLHKLRSISSFFFSRPDLLILVYFSCFRFTVEPQRLPGSFELTLLLNYWYILGFLEKRHTRRLAFF
jgi:hypothetical protein